MPSSRNSRKKKGKKGGRGKKQAARTTAAPANPPPGNTTHASREIESPNTNKIVTDPTSLPAEGTISRREKKDRKLVAKSMKLTPSSSRLFGKRVPLVKFLSDRMRLNVIGPDGKSVVTGNRSILRCKKAKDAYAIVKQNEGRWQEMFLSAQAFFYQEQWAECERSVSDALDDMDRALSHLVTFDDETENLILVLKFHIAAHHLRCRARFQLINFQGTIDDANEVLALLEAWKCSGNEEHWLSDKKCQLLARRGVCRSMLGMNLRGQEIDSRAACALFRSCKDRNAEMHDISKRMALRVMAEQKVQANAPRPHYTRKDADKIEKEFSVGIFNEEKYRCIGCGVEPSHSVELFRCGGCKSVWLCGEACQKKTWEGGHKQCCKARRFQIGHNQKCELEEKGTRIIIVGFGDGFRAICRDEEAGHFFDSLSDEDVTFGKDDTSFLFF